MADADKELVFGNGHVGVVAVKNPTQAQQEEFEKISAVVNTIRHDPKVEKALASIHAREDGYKAEHAQKESIPADRERKEEQSARKAVDKLLGAIAHSFEKHGIKGAPATYDDLMAARADKQVLQAAEQWIMKMPTAKEEEVRIVPDRAPDTPPAGPLRAAPRSLYRG